jgi:RNA-directed DNA polymerase
VANKYWHKEGDRNWAFGVKNEESNNFFGLLEHKKTPIVRHAKVKGEASPFDGNLTYWSSRMGTHPEVSTRVATLLKKQKGKCTQCGLIFRDEDRLEVDHIIPKSQKGKNSYNNLQLLHRHCHDTKTAEDRRIEAYKKKQEQEIEKSIWERGLKDEDSLTIKEREVFLRLMR